jgi:hypothetical protein
MVTLNCGDKKCLSFKNLRAATIETTYRQKDVAIGSELRGEKRVDPKPLLVVPAIMCLCEVIAQGHIQEGANGGGASA